MAVNINATTTTLYQHAYYDSATEREQDVAQILNAVLVELNKGGEDDCV